MPRRHVPFLAVVTGPVGRVVVVEISKHAAGIAAPEEAPPRHAGREHIGLRPQATAGDQVGPAIEVEHDRRGQRADRDRQRGARRIAVTVGDERSRNLANAPEQQDGLFLVPRVIE